MKAIIFGVGFLFVLVLSVSAEDEAPEKEPAKESQKPEIEQLKPAVPEVPIPKEQRVIYTPLLLRTQEAETVIAVSTHDLVPGYDAGVMAEDYLGFDIKRRGKVGNVNATITIKSLPDVQLIIIILRYSDAKGPPAKQQPPPQKKVQTRGIFA